MTFADLLHARAQGPAAARTVFTALDADGSPAAELTAAELDLAARTLAARLRTVAEPGDRVLLPALPELGFPVAFFACSYARLVAVPTPPIRFGRSGADRYTRLVAICQDCAPAAVVVPEGQARVVAAAWADHPELAALQVVPVAGPVDREPAAVAAQRVDAEPAALPGAAAGPGGPELAAAAAQRVEAEPAALQAGAAAGPGGSEPVAAAVQRVEAGPAALPGAAAGPGGPGPVAAAVQRVEAGPAVLQAGAAAGPGGSEPVAAAAQHCEPMPGPDPAGPEELALLQYTSGSTTQPRGVMLSHRALLANQEMLRRHFAVEPGNTLVSWLPTYHDMGLCLGILQPLYSGAQAVVMAPETFVMRPERWLRALSGRPGAMTAAPDTAYAWCTRRTREAAKTGLDLSGWRVAITGAEPIRPETLRGFQSAFGGCGLPATAATPAYGLAEATLFVTSSPADAPPTVRSYARDALAAGRAEEAAGVELVSCGEPAPGVEIAIVDPATLHVLPPRRVGEIWVRSPANGTGYWGRPELSRETFDVRLKSHGRGWLRTGDLGFLDGPELFVTGRRKDVIVVNGANYHPQDFEVLATAAHPLFDGELAVACWTGERVTILVEAADRTDPGALTTAAAAAVRAVTAELPVDTEVVAVTRGRIPRTTSGKPRRHECARRFRDGEVPVLTRWPQRKRLPDTG